MNKKVKESSHCSEPLFKKIGTVQFVSNREAAEIFKMFHDAIRKAPILALPEDGGEYVLHSDASKYAVGAVLSQKRQDGETRGIGYWSRKFESVVMVYPTYDRELLATHDAVVHAHYYLHLARKFVVHTDHASLTLILIQPWLTTS